jgi:biopolymer transport protein TolR
MALIQGGKLEDVMSEINITPFTDVLLVLLIIFMLLASLVSPPGFEKSLPNRGTATITDTKIKNKTIEVTVNAHGGIMVDDVRSSANGVYRALARAAAFRGHLHVSLLADTNAPYGVIIRVLDAAKLAKLNDVGFVTQ